MKLDCRRQLRDIGSNSETWEIVDYDRNQRVLVTGESVEDAWYRAAMRMEQIINQTLESLNQKAP